MEYKSHPYRMNNQFYIVLNGQKAGPFRVQDLKAKNINEDTLVWTEGMPDWIKAGQVPELAGFINYNTPPVPSAATADSTFGYTLASRRERFFAALIQGILIAIPLLILFGDSLTADEPFSLESIAGWSIFSGILGALFYPLWGGNLGHKILGLQVISAKTGAIQKRATAGALREAVKSVLGFIILPSLWLLWDKKRQNLYDKLVKTYVVKKKSGGIKRFFRGCLVYLLTFFFIILLIVFGSVYFYIDGIPAVSSFVVDRLPASVDNEVGAKIRTLILKEETNIPEKTALITSFYQELGYDEQTKIFVLKSDEFNAFAVPDNSIFVYDQVFRELKTYPELAALLGHEYAHIKQRHGMKLLAHALSRELLTKLLTGGDNADQFIKNANTLLTLKNSRRFEKNADKGGFDLLVQHGTDPGGMVTLFKRMAVIEAQQNQQIPEYLRTHPDIQSRLTLAEERVKQHQNKYEKNAVLDSLFHMLISTSNGKSGN